MTKLNWDRVNMENLMWRRVNPKKAKKLPIKKNPPIILKGKSTRLIQCSHKNCTAQLNPKNLSKHLQKAHSSLPKVIISAQAVITKVAPVPLPQKDVSSKKLQVIITSNSLAMELQTYLPNLILKMVKVKGVKIDSLEEEIPLQVAEKIRRYFKSSA